MRLGRVLVCGIGMVLLLAWVQTWMTVTIVDGKSMEPLLQTGDMLWVDRRAYLEAKPERGDVVVARHRGEWIVKRVVGLPGERVEVRDGVLWIDGNPYEETQETWMGPMTIRPGRLRSGRYALLGDNRSEFAGTLVHAVVSEAAIVGKLRARWATGRRAVSGSLRAERRRRRR